MSEEQQKKKPARPVGGISQYTQFGSENDQEDDTPGSQEASRTVESQTSTTGRQDTSMPVQQFTSKTVKQEAGLPVQQEDRIPVFMKGTYYINPEHDMKLERIRLARRIKGQRIDKSALIREAIDLLQE